ncbi:MAG TPA: DUF362 domain-containing protein, partial [Limnochordia bacterium]|nr:DUF362 domain-containing protein [Limnochordia bacterium]
RRFEANELADPKAEVYARALAAGRAAGIGPGRRIAVGVGSRGVHALTEMVRGLVDALRELGAEVFIVPAMGSHGGATPKGQAEVLATYGVTEGAMGAPIDASLETEVIDHLPDGTPVHFARSALAADGVVWLNRVKPHTDFGGPLGSGLMKMLVIGFGKEAGAAAIHAHGAPGLRELVPLAAERIVRRAPLSFGVAVVENAFDHPAEIRALRPEALRSGETELMQLAARWLPRLPVDELDVLVVDALGKEISGSGMDTNVIGRLYIQGEPEFERPVIRRIAVLDVSEASHGNAIGVGLADVTTRRLVEKIDWDAFHKNAITSTFLERGRIPMAMPTDKAAIELALATCRRPHGGAGLIRIENTAKLGRFWASEPVANELAGREDIELLGPAEPWPFDERGNLF